MSATEVYLMKKCRIISNLKPELLTTSLATDDSLINWTLLVTQMSYVRGRLCTSNLLQMLSREKHLD